MVAYRTMPNQSSPITRRIRLVIACLVLVASIPFAVGAAAQPGTPYETELLGWNIDVTGPNYTLENVALEEYPHGQGERVYITSLESLGFVEISFFDDEDTPEQTVDLMLRDFDAASRSLEVLDSGFANDIHYALARFELEQGMAGYFYIEVAEDVVGNTDVSQSLYTLDSDFLEQLDLARSEISLEGLPFLAQPAIDLESKVSDDQVLLASTPEPIATPDQGNYTFRTTDVVLDVQGSIEFDFPLINRELDIMFLRSANGYGVAGFVHQEVESAEQVMAGIFLDAPPGDEAPVELYKESDNSRVFGVYRVETQGETRAMIIEITRIDDGLWQVEAMAVVETSFHTELVEYQSGVTLGGDPLLGDIDAEEVVMILNEND